jgi:hypothetical protein
MAGAGMELSDLKECRKGETAWVFGSGGTLNHLDPAFFDGKLIVSTNLAPVRFGVKHPQFLFTHYHSTARDALDHAGIVVTLACDTLTQQPWEGGVPHRLVLIPQNTYVGPSDMWDPNSTHRPRPDSLAYGSSSLHGAMHLAAHIGAAHIVMVGADCGMLDNESNLEGYRGFQDDNHRDRILSLYERDHRRMKQYLIDTYGVTVYSLNPFINLNLEGHTFVGPDNRY